MKNFKKILNPDKLSTLLLYSSILTFIIAFNFAHNPPSGWYQQFLPNLNNLQVSDIFFLDSLTGWVVTGNEIPHDTSGYIFKTTNGGDNWNLKFSDVRDFTRVKFLNHNTGFVSGQFGEGAKLYKTTNGGDNWLSINIPGGGQVYFNDMSVLSEDTIWYASRDGLIGGLFRTTNGGMNWIRQFGGLSDQNPDKIYMFNSRIGFIVRNFGTPTLRKTTDGGFNWFPVLNEGFTDMHFADSLVGWKCWGEIDSIKHTTNGGMNWIKQFLPPEKIPLFYSRMLKFTFVNKDTGWGVGGAYTYTGFDFKGIIYKTTNGGKNWGYQLPDTNNINIGRYVLTDFHNRLNGWAYSGSSTGVHTVSGGDTITHYTVINPISNYVPQDFKLQQNYPNPFNPKTIIKYQLSVFKNVSLKVYDILGNEIKTLVNANQHTGSYNVEFDGGDLPSGVYFYSLFIDGEIVDTKKMLLVR